MDSLPTITTPDPTDLMSLAQLAKLLGYTRTDNLFPRIRKFLPRWLASGDAFKETRLVPRKNRGYIPAVEYWFNKKAASKIVLLASNRPNTGIDFQQIIDSLGDDADEVLVPTRAPKTPEPPLPVSTQLRLPPGVLRAPLPEGRGELLSIQALPSEQRARIRTILEARSRNRTEPPPTKTLKAQK